MLLTIFVVDELTSYNSSRKNAFKGYMQSNSDISGLVFLPPYIMPEQCDISAGSEIVVLFDETSGYGVAQIGFDNAEFSGKLNYDLTTTGSIKADNDIQAGAVSMQTHVHAATLGVTGTANLTTGVVGGEAAGKTEVAQ